MADATLTRADPEVTLPSVAACLARSGGTSNIVLTIIFHPDPRRIGYSAVMPALAGGLPWLLGRRSPTFSVDDGRAPCALDDAHISRQALQLVARAGQLTVTRCDGASRCRLDSAELFDPVIIDSTRLQRGVAMLLGHSVVLLLRSIPRAQEAAGLSVRESGLRGGSRAMVAVRQQLAQVARCDLDVLICGETGTGKELVAHAIHRTSARSGGPMVSVNMAAIPSELAPAALFGTARGAFTGAERAVPGFFEQAHRGCLFLDEIGAAPPAVQTQLLRALQQGEIQRIGGPVQRVDVRVISATDAVIEGDECTFRSALRHRLGACRVDLPPLRERPEDIGELMQYFFEVTAGQCDGIRPLPGQGMSAAEIAGWALLFFAFLRYHWPGNVRELQNCVRQVLLAEGERPVVPAVLQAAQAAAPQGATASARVRRLQEVDDATFDKVMVANGFEIKRVAAQLGVSRAAVYRRIADSTHYRLASTLSSQEIQSALDACGGDSLAVARHLRVPLNPLRRRMRNCSLQWR